MALAALVVCGWAAGCTSPDDPSQLDVPPSPPHGNPCVRAGRACVDMYVVAHEDDELLFMNPDIQHSIAAGNHVVVVHLTAGDLTAESVAEHLSDQPDPPDFTRFWVDRERGVLNALTAMAVGYGAALTSYAPAGVAPPGWARVGDAGSTAITVTGVAMAQYDLTAASGQTVSAVFLRLSDAQLQTAWNDLPGGGGRQVGLMLPAGSLVTDGCVDPAVCLLGSTIASQQLTRDQLIDALAGLMERFAADSVSAQDATTPTRGPDPAGMFWDVLNGPRSTPHDPHSEFTEYWDHVYGAAFVVAAASRAQAAMASPLALRLYRGYTISQEPPNLDDSQAAAKELVFARYAVFDAGIVPHYSAFDVDHPVFQSTNYSFLSGSWQRRQLATRTLLAEQPLQGRLAIGGGCVGIAVGAPALVACDDAPSWLVTATNQLAAADGTACLAVDQSGAIELVPCAPQAPASTLFLFANGQLRSPEAQCVSAVDAELVSAECAHEPLSPHATGLVPSNQDFTLLFERARQVSDQLSDATVIASAPSYYQTLRLVHGSLCVRGPDGVSCARYADGGLGAPALIGQEYSDAQGWQPPHYGATVAASWDPATQSIIECGRGRYELVCGRRRTTEFAGAEAVRYADLLGRGGIDVCGRTPAGIQCAIDAGAGWSSAQRWTGWFSDAQGWGEPAYGETVQLGDVDGDGLLDACGRSSHGIECAVQLQTGSGAMFADASGWSFDEDRSNSHTEYRQDFSDTDLAEPWAASEAYYRSFRLVDINRDGLADICARGSAGIYCALSTGTAFERKKLVVPDEFTDARDWSASSRGTTLTWGDLDGSGRATVCGRGGGGVVCATGY